MEKKAINGFRYREDKIISTNAIVTMEPEEPIPNLTG